MFFLECVGDEWVSRRGRGRVFWNAPSSESETGKRTGDTSLQKRTELETSHDDSDHTPFVTNAGIPNDPQFRKNARRRLSPDAFRARDLPPSISIRVSLKKKLESISVASSPIRTIHSAKDSHGLRLSRTPSIALVRRRLHHSLSKLNGIFNGRWTRPRTVLRGTGSRSSYVRGKRDAGSSASSRWLRADAQIKLGSVPNSSSFRPHSEPPRSQRVFRSKLERRLSLCGRRGQVRSICAEKSFRCAAAPRRRAAPALSYRTFTHSKGNTSRCHFRTH